MIGIVDITKEELERLYVHEKLSLQAIARMYGRGLKWAQIRMKQHGIPTRTRHESLRATWEKRGNTVNENFFSEWSPEMAYALGWFITDGCVKKDGYSVILTLKDRDVLERIAHEMDLGSGVHEIHQASGRTYFTITVSRPKIKADLISLGVTPQKTKTVQYPTVPVELEHHFIRGALDGDGSVSFNRGKRQWQAEIEKASKDFIYGMRDAIERHTGITPYMSSRPSAYDKTLNRYRLMVSKQNDMDALYRWLYEGVPNGLWLERKYKKFRMAAGLDEMTA